MTAASDLDLMLIYDFPAEASELDGRKRSGSEPLLCAPDPAPCLGSDRAHKSGAPLRSRHAAEAIRAQGLPLATQFASFKLYQEDEAETWEHMALTRARFVAGDTTLDTDLARTVAADADPQARHRQNRSGNARYACADRLSRRAIATSGT